jgi:hypothetical protein
LRKIASLGEVLTPLRPLLDRSSTNNTDLRTLLLAHFALEAHRRLLERAAEPGTALLLVEEVSKRAEEAKRTGDAVIARTGLDAFLWLGKPRESWTARELLARIARAVEAPERLDTWLTYDLDRRRAADPRLSELLGLAESGSFPAQHLGLAFEYLTYEHAARRVLQGFPQLRQQQGTTLADLARRYAELDEEVMEARRAAIATRLRMVPVPRGNSAVQISGLTDEALLRHELSKQKRHLPVRKLVERAGGAL